MSDKSLKKKVAFFENYDSHINPHLDSIAETTILYILYRLCCFYTDKFEF